MFTPSRRQFFSAVTAGWAVSLMRCPASRTSHTALRTFHLCTNPLVLDQEPDRLELYRSSGITDIWLAGFFYGFWPAAIDRLIAWKKKIENAGMACHVANIPLGHPGDSLGAGTNDFPLAPASPWRLAVRPDGSTYAGTSLHAPATEENCAALRRLRQAGFKRVFLDDDFRLATGPGVIGGCFCADHRKEFLQKYGYGESDWQRLLECVRTRRLSSPLRDWLNWTCDQLTGSFRQQQAAMPDAELGIMVMYLGAEKAGIRLSDYQGCMLRVGELMFDDRHFNELKNKTKELFSSLFHRRYVTPELAYSETTAFPADRLSAENMTAKLAISTLSDVRNTMFMSGITPFPAGHWTLLAPAMKKHAAIHEKVAGHIPRGPFKHYWGDHSRLIGDDHPNSLFLAAGTPFEVSAAPAEDGWTFLADYDARAAAEGELRSRGTVFVAREEAGLSAFPGPVLADRLQAMFAFKHRCLDHRKDVPYIREDLPAVCAWYPSARSVLIWNLEQAPRTYTLVFGEQERRVTLPGLDLALLSNIVAD